jgi:tetratricopeptide (TPR) repeat protein
MQRAWLFILLAGLLMVSASAIAASDQEPEETTTQLDEAARREQAKTLFERGVSLYRDERYREALNYFIGAQNLYANKTITFNIARTCERIKDVPCALRNYREYRRAAQNANDLDEVAGHIEVLESELSRKGVQQVTLFSEPAGAVLVVDGLEKGTTPWTGELSPGQHRAHLKHPGFTELEVHFLVQTAHAVDWSYQLQPAAIAPKRELPSSLPKAASQANTPGITPAPARHDQPSRAAIGSWTWIALGSGVATLGVAGVLEALRARSENAVHREATQLERVAAYDRMRDYQQAARISAGAGIALTALGLTLMTVEVTRSARNQRTLAASCGSTECRLDLRGLW